METLGKFRSMGGKPVNKRITAFLPPEKAQLLEEWARKEHRAVGNLAAAILINAIEAKGVEEKLVSDKEDAA